MITVNLDKMLWERHMKLCGVLECVPGDIPDYQPDPEGTEMEEDIYAD